MAMVPRLGSMRIIALPLARPGTNASKLPIFYRYKIIAPPPIKKTVSPRGMLTRWMPEEGLGKWASHKANQTWTGFGMAPDGTMKKRAFQLGERLMDRLDFEESDLKTIDLSIAPPLEPKDQTVEGGNDMQVPLLYPATVFSGPQSLEHLKSLVTDRIPLHNRGLMMWIFFAILSAPLKLIPIIPNFPFYFCAWRSWSHWKAKRAAEYIQGLIQSNRIVPAPLQELNAVYGSPVRTKLDGSASSILPRERLERAMRALTMTPEESKELLRAHEQVLSRLKNEGKTKTS
ncbi:mitochondrial K+-H+ exchange-related-domain-containing protein [Mycena capillaripes]|nr:mitochondrial K+-H+ exchange-related-domain-containing protein [Mycena capillaripes]